MAYRPKGVRQIGITQMVIGALMIVLGIACIAAVNHWSSYIAFGIWIGIWVLITGILAYTGARSDTSPNNCILGTMIGFAIVSCVITSVMVICYAISLAEFSRIVRCNTSWHYDSWYCQYHSGYTNAKAGLGLGAVLLILAIAGFFVALASSIYGCNACCCATAVRATATQQVMYVQQGIGQPGVVCVGPNGVISGATTIQTIQTTYPGQQGVILQQQGMPIQGAWGPPPPQGYPVQGGYAAAPPPQGYPVQGGYAAAPPPQPGSQQKYDMPPPYAQ